MLTRLAAVVLMLIASAGAATAAGLSEDRALIDAAFDLNLKDVRTALAKGANPNVKRFEKWPLGGVILTPVLLSAVLGEPAKDGWLMAGSDKSQWAGVS